MSQLGDLLKQLRGNRSLREASKLTGISHNYLSIVERGLDPRSGAPVSPTPETLKKLSEAYQYDYEELMKKAGYIEGDSTPKRILDEQTKNKAIEIYNRLPDEDKVLIDDMIMALEKRREK